MGGLSRKLSYINTLRNNNRNPIILDAGDALFARPSYQMMQLPSQQYKAEALIQGYEKIGCDAINVGQYDLAGGLDFLKKLDDKYSIPFISANIYDQATGKLAFEPYSIVNRGKLKVGVIGVTDKISVAHSELYQENYLEAGKAQIDKLRNKVDILIMLVNGNSKDKDSILESFKEADYVYLSRPVMYTRANVEQKDGYPIFYTFSINGKQILDVKTTILDKNEPIKDVSSYQTRSASIGQQVIRLKKTNKGQTLEEKYADNPLVINQIKTLEKQTVELAEKMKAVVNSSEIKIVSLPKNMDYDLEMQSFIDKALEEAKKQ